jgi:hypothetical protein
MKKQIYLVILLLNCICKFSTAQILCIYCYDQNDSISSGVNNLVSNGGFENSNCIPGSGTNCFCPASQYYNCDVTDWICTGGGSITYAQIFDSSQVFTTRVEGARGVYMGNMVCKACSTTPNDTSCLNSLSCEVTGIPTGYPINDTAYGGTAGVSLEQTVNGLIIGNSYVLEFWAGGEGGYPRSGLFAVDIGFGYTFLRCKPVLHGEIGTRFIIEFIATSASHTIKFTNWGHIFASVCTELSLDDVKLYTIAELSVTVPHCNIGIKEQNANTDINISPNPFSNELNFIINNKEDSEIILYDITSRKLLQQQFTNSVTLNTSQLANGIYIYEVRNKNGMIKKGKVVKN